MMTLWCWASYIYSPDLGWEAPPCWWLPQHTCELRLHLGIYICQACWLDHLSHLQYNKAHPKVLEIPIGLRSFEGLPSPYPSPSDLWSTERKSWQIAGWKILVDQLTSISFGLKLHWPSKSLFTNSWLDALSNTTRCTFVPVRQESTHNKYPLYKVYMGLIIKGRFPRAPPFALWNQGELAIAPTRSLISYLSTLAKDATPPVLWKDSTRKHDMGNNGEQQKTTGKIPSGHPVN